MVAVERECQVVYQPVLGRFLAADPFVQAPNMTQNFNRYSYCLNNPLRFADTSGELFGIDDAIFIVVASAIIGGTINAISNGQNIHNFWDALGYFSVGAAAGAVGAYAGGAIAIGGVIGGALSGLVSGASAGGILGAGNSFMTNGNFNQIWSDALNGMIAGGVSGAVVGGIAGGVSSYLKGENIWTGKANPTSIEPRRPQNPQPDAMPTKEVGVEQSPSYLTPSNENATLANPRELIHYTSKDNYIEIMKTKELKASIGKTHARYGNGQYFTDIESQSFTIGQVSRRLYGVPWVRNKLQYFIKIDVTGLNIVQNIPHNFLLPGNNSLNLQNRIIDSGITIFKIKF